MQILAAILLVLAVAAPAVAQTSFPTDQAGNMRFAPGVVPATLSGWTSGTSVNATQNIFTSSGVGDALVTLDQGSTISAGAIKFEVSWIPGCAGTFEDIPADAVIDPKQTTWTTISLPYTLQASTIKPFLILNRGWPCLRIKLSTAITGSATVTPYYVLYSYAVVSPYVQVKGNAGAVLDGVNTAATAPANGVLGLGIYNSTEPSPSTGQSVGVQLDSKGRQRHVIMDAAGNTRGMNVDSNNNAGVVLPAETTKVIGTARVLGNAGGAFDQATGSAVPANAVYHGGNSSGNLKGAIFCDSHAEYDTNTNGSTKLVSGVSAKLIYICGYVITTAATTQVTVKLQGSTGDNCTTLTAITPAYVLQAPSSVGPTGVSVVAGQYMGLNTATTGGALCLTTNAGQSVQAQVFYTQF